MEVDNNNNNNKDLPTSVHSKDALLCLPDEFLSKDPQRPLQNYSNEDKKTYTYALNPLFYSVIFILVIEGLERFTYYGINFTQTNYLTGYYDPHWNAGMTSAEATSFVSETVGLAYTAPFIGGILADALLGDYWGIIVGVLFFYLPGLILVALTTYPNLLGSTFNQKTLRAGMLALYPLGTGFIKSLVNVFGAKQYHPVLQSDAVETYYISFYMAINVGSLIGGIVIPIICQINVSVAYTIPACALALGLLVFLLGSTRYVRQKPQKTALFNTFKVLGRRVLLCQPMESMKKSRGGSYNDTFIDGIGNLLAVIPISCLITPFLVCYSQMSTVLIIQGNAMRAAGLFDAAMMNNFDAISVLLSGLLVGRFLFPYLERRGIHLAVTYKFAMGTTFGTLAIVAAILVDYQVHSKFEEAEEAGSDLTDYRISVFYQIFSYMLIGAGEIFAVATAYDVAFTIAPKEQKGLASAFNLFLTLGLSSYISAALAKACADMFPAGTDGGNTEHLLQAYSESRLFNYLWIQVGIAAFGVLINLAPPVKNWVWRVHDKAVLNNLNNATSAKDDDSDSSKNDDDSKKGDVEEIEVQGTKDNDDEDYDDI